jgi:hypothetical protein
MLLQRYNQEIKIYPGRDDRAAGNGWSCAELLFLLTDTVEPGAATFALRTDWLPPNMTGGMIRPLNTLSIIDLIYHFPVPTMTATQDKRDICPYVGGQCFSVTDRKSGPLLLALLQTDGTAGVWPMLEQLFEIEARIQRPRMKGGL